LVPSALFSACGKICCPGFRDKAVCRPALPDRFRKMQAADRSGPFGGAEGSDLEFEAAKFRVIIFA